MPQTLFAVTMTCGDCAKDVASELYKLPGITKVESNLEDQSVSVEGTAPPSTIVKAIQSTGRDAILRGSGTSNSAAVSILETYHGPSGKCCATEAVDAGTSADNKDRYVRGLARMVQVAPSISVIDLTVQGVSPGTYYASIREYGNLQSGAVSTGPIWSGEGIPDVKGSGRQQQTAHKGHLGSIEVGLDGRGEAFLEKEFQVWELIGRALVVSPLDESRESVALQNDADTVVGVIARSAGVWDNDKTVCSCTGKTLWDERKDEVKKGML
ncbi:superoxide dismutase copper chaperone [Grosmannia clavigera kw1407]|uniref:Superoxide dismutase 1 copper chaperone n=1 Tax=Grosmannia clavigera (strain kw1407 / UAMH 11150) TaxID=655863 RepID=F0XIW4_GROCL|nr:superoxide dismutase copper chaperone [Grosmannia clavigera kw1407]EFX02031.1 superoxide dismutase copper chaperone [Grosmannia clavigera kw1407]